jgi:DNA-binding MarR family transcriptional regulator
MSSANPSGQTNHADQTSRRAELHQQLQIAGREQSAATVMFHTVLAAQQGLSATEEKALDLLDRFGPLTAGQLAQRSGLAPASVTGLVDRLERKGFARRVPHPVDKRSVLIEVCPDRLAALGPLFDDWWRSMTELFSSYSDEQLETILHFLNEATRRQHEATARLTT